MAKRTRDAGARDWAYLVAGLGGLVSYLHRVDEPHWMIVASLCALAGRPVFAGLADVIGSMTGRDDDDAS